MLSTLAAVALGIGVVWALRRAPGWWGRRKLSRGRVWGVWRGRGDSEEVGDAERRPLLGREREEEEEGFT